MAITNAQQYQQLVNKPADGKRPGYRGDAAYRSASEQSTSIGQGNVGSQESFGGSQASDGSEGAGAINTSQYTTSTQDENQAAIQKAAKEKAAKEKEKAKAKEAKEKAKKEKKAAKEKAKKEKKLQRMRTKAFEKYQQLDPYAVDEMSFYGLSAEDIAKGKGLGAVDLGQKKSLLGEDSIYEGGQANPLEVEGNIAGYDLTGLPMGKPTLTSNKGTSIEKTIDNPYPLQTKTGIPSVDLLGQFMNPDDQVGALNTLEDARNIQDFAKRYAEGDDSAYQEYEDYLVRNKPPVAEGGGGDPTRSDPCLGPNPPAYCNLPQDPTTPPPPSTGVFAGIAPRFAGSIFDFDALRANAMDGGMIEDTPVGGIMDLESGRQMYFLGKLVKKATRAVKKIAKSPFGKAALGAALFKFGGGFGGGKGLGSFFGKGSFNPLKALITTTGQDGAASGLGLSKLGQIFNKFGMATGEGNLTLGGKIGLGFGIPFALDALGVGKDDDKKMDLDEYYKTQGIDVDYIRRHPFSFSPASQMGSLYNFADGGRTGYQEGGDAEPVAKKTMPLIDMNGKEKDYRETGGFVDMGRMERADDVPARLSKNEFVFTADAVRNAGEGDIDKGAEVMYNMMKNLEAGGEVSEESQGLEGARKMFQTSQRLGEVL